MLLRILALLLLVLPLLTAARAGRPNIVLIMADDMGFSDLGCYGSEIETPNLDRLATNGLRFSQFYNTGRCCPTRASLLTGLYPHQAGVGWMTPDWKLPAYRGFLNRKCVTIAEALQPTGYFTITTGKWHVGSGDGQRPHDRGFQRSYSIAEGGGFYYKVRKGRSVWKNGTRIHDHDNQVPEGWYTTHAFTTEGMNFVEEAVAEEKPFFWYLAHIAPHFPLQAPAATIAKYRGQYRDGWDPVRKKRHERQLASGLFRKPWPLSPRHPNVPEWQSLDAKQRDQLDHLMAAYAACVDEMDQTVGWVIEALEKQGVLDDTLILFCSDNGGCAEGGMLGTYKGDPTSADSNFYCGKAWANAQDTPFRWFKHYTHEGGIATPLIAHWPKGIPSRGTITHSPGHVIDFLPTVLELAGADYPSQYRGQGITPVEGRSLVPILRGKTRTPHLSLFWEHEGHRAVRQGDWKLVARHKQPWALYDLATDRTELRDVATSHPDRMRAMEAAYGDWAKRCQVIPWDKTPKKKW